MLTCLTTTLTASQEEQNQSKEQRKKVKECGEREATGGPRPNFPISRVLTQHPTWAMVLPYWRSLKDGLQKSYESILGVSQPCFSCIYCLYTRRNFWYLSHLLQQSLWWKTFEFSHFKEEYLSCTYFAKSLSTINIWVMVWNTKEGFFFLARLIFHYQVRSA